MTDSSEWSGGVGASWAQLWRETDRSFGPLTAALLDHPAAHEFAVAVDIGCGAGEVTCRLADRQPRAQVTGVDISSELLGVARQRCPAAHFAHTDAAVFVPDGAAPDLLVSRHGVMFFPDPTAAFRHLARIAAPGAALRFSCFRPREENTWAVQLAGIVDGDTVSGDPDAPGPFAFGNSLRVAQILEAAGWRDARFDRFDYPMLAGEGPNAVDQAYDYFQRIGPAARALAELAGTARAEARLRLRALVEANHGAGRVELPASAWIVTARADGRAPG